MTCVFCRIARGEVQTTAILEDDALLAFEDIDPAAPVHVLVVPRKHITSLADVQDEDRDLLGRLLLAARDVARRRGLAEDGYRIITNVGEFGGQEVFHFHLHVLGGRPLGRLLSSR